MDPGATFEELIVLLTCDTSLYSSDCDLLFFVVKARHPNVSMIVKTKTGTDLI